MRYLAAFLVAAPLAASAADPVPAGYSVRNLCGFTTLVHKSVLEQPADRWRRRPLDVLELEFNDLKRVLAPKLFELLRGIPVYVHWDAAPADSGVVAVYRSAADPSRLKEGERARANCVDILTLRRLGELRPPGSRFQQIVTLHEMAHAVHHRLLGFDAPEVLAAFQQAVDRKLYDDVWDRTNRRGRAYARTNANEYFAEISCAYLDSCHFYPFTYSDLRGHDPAGFALAESVWKHPERYVRRRVAPVVTPRFALPNATAAGPTAERVAFTQLDRARALMRDGKREEARGVIESLVQNYPTTLAAADARRLLEQIR
jgi:hypothetical protein